MYYYIANPKAGNERLTGLQVRLKANLERSGIGGPFAKTLGDGDAYKLAVKAIEKKAKTIVVIGGDETLNEVINAVHKTKSQVAIGIIPTGQKNKIASALGINNWRQACLILRKRRVASFSLMTINDQTSLYSVDFSLPVKAGAGSFKYELACDEAYTLKSEAQTISIFNQKFINPSLENKLAITIGTNSGKSKSLWQRLSAKTANETRVLAQKCVLTTQKPIEASSEGGTEVADNFKISLNGHKVSLIVGKAQG